ncbi:MAG: hypothetical protein UX65_C0006G0018 [Parcubacteria group bacterium GW2011_GWB1_46_8]|nr:MAG: hypothetical protein UX14_C0007G0021 [Parcubacteria group bacterium GW2011_GWF1_45_5]KKU46253.1 MAG: hypothetical protein UX65_C0006G0018 [Parcubacteria group bacterium GW2011_GWB1_46_8]
MFSFSFIIDRDVCFAYWVQSLIKWGWYFSRQKADFYLKFVGPLTQNEQDTLEALKLILQKDKHGFLWLWARYAGEPIKDKTEESQWGAVQTAFKQKFEIVWDLELPLLESWKNLLQGVLPDTRKFDQAFNKIFLFYSVIPFDAALEVKFASHWNSDTPVAHVKQEYPSAILLALSRTKREKLATVVNTILHEACHKIDYQSSISDKLIKDAWERILSPLNIKLERDYKWKHLLKETVLYTMASGGVSHNYLERIAAERMGEIFKIEQKPLKENVKKDNYGELIALAASRIEPMVSQYLDTGKQMDSTLADAVAQVWGELLGSSGGQSRG